MLLHASGKPTCPATTAPLTLRPGGTAVRASATSKQTTAVGRGHRRQRDCHVCSIRNDRSKDRQRPLVYLQTASACKQPASSQGTGNHHTSGTTGNRPRPEHQAIHKTRQPAASQSPSSVSASQPQPASLTSAVPCLFTPLCAGSLRLRKRRIAQG